jgi:mannosylglycoprotein endo-beta-mannosidase
MFLFNEIIGHLGLLELPLKGRRFTWSNMQAQPLLEELDWFFTSAEWISSYPNTTVMPLANTASDHVPCVVNIDTVIPKASIFRFESFWVDQPGFMDCVKKAWDTSSTKKYTSTIIAGKFKELRYALKHWHMNLSQLKFYIQHCNKAILILDNLEDQRPLFVTQFNFRKIVKLHLEKLLQIECNYWRKRCTVRWVKVGEDNTKFFHAMATQRNRRNTISMIKDADGRVVNDHAEIAALLWSSYRDRMGNSEGINMQFDLPRLINRIQGLEEISQPFLQEEIELVLKQMPPDKSPGPDGFTGLFLKKCWPIIKQDFFKLVHDFHEGTLQLQNINESFITLVPKVHSPESVNDYRPISLINACLKFLTKLVANIFQQRILSCVHKN